MVKVTPLIEGWIQEEFEGEVGEQNWEENPKRRKQGSYSGAISLVKVTQNFRIQKTRKFQIGDQTVAQKYKGV